MLPNAIFSTLQGTQIPTQTRPCKELKMPTHNPPNPAAFWLRPESCHSPIFVNIISRLDSLDIKVYFQQKYFPYIIQTSGTSPKGYNAATRSRTLNPKIIFLMLLNLLSPVLNASAVSSSMLMTATAIQMGQTGSSATRWLKRLSGTPKLQQLQKITGGI